MFPTRPTLALRFGAQCDWVIPFHLIFVHFALSWPLDFPSIFVIRCIGGGSLLASDPIRDRVKTQNLGVPLSLRVRVPHALCMLSTGSMSILLHLQEITLEILSKWLIKVMSCFHIINF